MNSRMNENTVLSGGSESLIGLPLSSIFATGTKLDQCLLLGFSRRKGLSEIIKLK